MRKRFFTGATVFNTDQGHIFWLCTAIRLGVSAFASVIAIFQTLIRPAATSGNKAAANSSGSLRGFSARVVQA